MTTGRIEKLIHWWPRFRARIFTLLISTQFKEIGHGSRVSPPFRCYGLHEMSLGEGVIIHRDCWIHVVGISPNMSAPRIVIKSHAGIGMGATISAAQEVVIGEYALLARNVYISDHSHAYEDTTVPIMHQGVSKIKAVSIGARTWLGQNAVVLPGVSIGRHCIVGANSVVNTSIPDYCIAVGAPARVVRSYNASTRVWEKVK